MGKTCYWCGAPATSREHVPPKCIFPESKDTLIQNDYRKNLITVPSCDLHNSAKSADDEYLLHVLSLSVTNNSHGQQQALSKVVRTFAKYPSIAQDVFHEKKEVNLINSHNGNVEQTLAINLDDGRFDSIVEHMARAIYFSAYGKSWVGIVSNFAEFVIATESQNAIENNERNERRRQEAELLFAGAEKIGANPDIFYYQIMNIENGKAKVLIRFTFYGGTRISACMLTQADLLKQLVAKGMTKAEVESLVGKPKRGGNYGGWIVDYDWNGLAEGLENTEKQNCQGTATSKWCYNEKIKLSY